MWQLKIGICMFFCAVLPQVLYSQDASGQADFSTIDSQLEELENLISDTISCNETLEKQLRDLKENLTRQERISLGRENSTAGQEDLLKKLRSELGEMSVTYKAQSDLSAKYEKSSRFWKIFTLVGIPLAILLSSGVTAALSAGR
jgi:septal ring factor EnvC (AmiA/AmiB activator)